MPDMKLAYQFIFKQLKNFFKILLKNLGFLTWPFFLSFPLLKTQLSVYYKMFLVIGTHLIVT